MRYNGKNLEEVLAAHKRWLKQTNKDNNDRAAFYESDLRFVDLNNQDLTYADFNRANLSYANLFNTVLYGAKLHFANLCNADLRGCDLRHAELSAADMRNCQLQGADLEGAVLRCANLYDADLQYAVNVPFIPLKCPEEGSFIGWKKAHGAIVKLQITEDAKRCSATSDKCRCSKAKVLALENPDGTPYGGKAVRSNYDRSFLYTVGNTVEVKDFDEDRWNECSRGIHFFINRQHAVEY